MLNTRLESHNKKKFCFFYFNVYFRHFKDIFILLWMQFLLPEYQENWNKYVSLDMLLIIFCYGLLKSVRNFDLWKWIWNIVPFFFTRWQHQLGIPISFFFFIFFRLDNFKCDIDSNLYKFTPYILYFRQN